MYTDESTSETRKEMMGTFVEIFEQIGKKFQIRISSIKLDTVRIEETTGDRCRNLSNTFLHR